MLETTRFCSTLVREMADAIIYADSRADPLLEGTRGLNASSASANPKHWTSPSTLSSGRTCASDTGPATTKQCAPAKRVRCRRRLAGPAIRKDKSRISVEFTIVPFRDALGAMVGVVAVLRDGRSDPRSLST
jgi:hypothetical protein